MIDIYFDNLKVAGIVVAEGRSEMLYDAAWRQQHNAFPISLSMPLGVDPIPAETTLPWLASLLPENHHSSIVQQFGASTQDGLGLLERIGRDTAGALEI